MVGESLVGNQAEKGLVVLSSISYQFCQHGRTWLDSYSVALQLCSSFLFYFESSMSHCSRRWTYSHRCSHAKQAQQSVIGACATGGKVG